MKSKLPFCKNLKRVCKFSEFVITAPIIISECPFMYFVNEYITISAPKSNGRCKYDDKNVLSTTTIISGYE